MKKILILFIQLLFFMNMIFAQTPDGFSYNGVLMDSSGNVIAKNTQADFNVSLYEAMTGGTAAFSQLISAVPVRNGYFRLQIGPGLPDLTIYRYLELSLNGEVLNPRIEISPAALAVRAGHALLSALAEDANRFSGMTKEQYAEYIYDDGLLGKIRDNLITEGSFFRKNQLNESNGGIVLSGVDGLLFPVSGQGLPLTTRIAVRDSGQQLDLFRLNSDGTVQANAYYGDGSQLSGISIQGLAGVTVVGEGLITLHAGAELIGLNSGDQNYPFASATLDGILLKEDWLRFESKADAAEYLLSSALTSSLNTDADNLVLTASAGRSLAISQQNIQNELSSHLAQANPHGLNKAFLGLSNVENINVYKSWTMDNGELLKTAGLQASAADGLKIYDFSGLGYWHMRGAGIVDLVGSTTTNASLEVKGKIKSISFEGSGAGLSGVLLKNGSQTLSGTLTANSFRALNGFDGDGSRLSGIDKQKLGLSEVANIDIRANWSQQAGNHIGTEQLKALAQSTGLRLASHSGQTGLLVKENTNGLIGVSLGGASADFTAFARLHIIGAEGQKPIHISTSIAADTAFYISEEARIGIGTSAAMMRLHVTSGAVCIGSEAYCEPLTDSEGFLYVTTIVAEQISSNKMVSESSVQTCTLTAEQIFADKIVSTGTVSGTTFIIEGGDYAEYFPAEKNLPAGYLVGLNLKTGLVRSYQPGDPLIGVVSTRPGILGNNIDFNANSLPVAVLGQVPIHDKTADFHSDGRVFTKDGLFIGYRLSDNRVWLRIDEKQEQLEILRQEISYLQKEVKRLADIIEKTMK